MTDELHYRTKGSEKLRKLREEPRKASEIPEGRSSNYCKGKGQRSLIRKFDIPISGYGGRKKKETTKMESSLIYYLYGDERRAIRKWIKTNSDIAKECMGYKKHANPIPQLLGDVMWEMFKEEYEIMEYNGEI